MLPAGTKLNTWLQWQVGSIWSIAAGIPSQLITQLEEKNQKLYERSRQDAESVDETIMKKNSSVKTGRSGEASKLASELTDWMDGLSRTEMTHPISMFNLLAFEPGKRDSYQQYAREFGTRVGAKHGVRYICSSLLASPNPLPHTCRILLTYFPIKGGAKLAGLTLPSKGKEEGWDEIAVAYYPSIRHFVDMIGSEAYREINERYRLGTLRDTCTLCTQEIDDRGELVGEAVRGERGRL